MSTPLPTLSLTASNRAARYIPFILVGIVLLMVVPLAPVVLDLLLATSVALAVSILLISIQIEKPLDLSSFPTILLFSTLLRLTLNVASTRLILLDGYKGSDAAGKVIRAFGEFVVGGNYVVGATVFLLLVIINFVVITKGSSRVAEVSARFTLDALPGKQMAIDADLAAGALTQEQAKLRRKEVEQESDFFGAMDGAAKFVRGDAIAGLIMTGMNIVVGFIVGVLQRDLSAAAAAETYTVLTVGDGLAAQIPSLLVSTAAGVVVTRAAAGASLGPTLVQQLGARHTALFGAAGIMALVALVPGMPAVPFLALAGALYMAGRSVHAAAKEAAAAPPVDTQTTTPERAERQNLEEILPVDLLELEVGFDLIPLVDAARGGELVERIAAIRRNLATELGIIIPSIQIRDNLRLKSNAYRFLLSGNEVGSGELRPGRFLAMDPTGTLAPIEGEQVKEPAFGLPARWIAASQREVAELEQYTVVDAATVAATHLTELIRSVAADLLGRSEAQELIDVLARREPRLVDELIPALLSLGDVVAVLRNLLREGISVRDLRTIFEGLADGARETKDAGLLTERVRERLARHITTRFRDHDGRVAALVLDPKAEEVYRNNGVVDAASAQRLLTSLNQQAHVFAGISTPPLVLCAPTVRRAVSEFLGRRIPGLSVLSYREIDPKATVRTLGVVTV